MHHPMSKAAILADASFLVERFIRLGKIKRADPTAPAVAPRRKRIQVHRQPTKRRVLHGTVKEAVELYLRDATEPAHIVQIFDALQANPNVNRVAVASALSQLEDGGKIKRAGTVVGREGRCLILWQSSESDGAGVQCG